MKPIARTSRAAFAARILIALALAAPVVCQDEAKPYFTLSTSKTYGSHEKAAVMLTGWEVDAVQIRVYRMKDPVAFFEHLADTHNFGGRPPRRGKRTLIERIHEWKRGLRRDIRLNLRGQFTESPRAQLAKLVPEKHAARNPTTAASSATYFAQAPVLNQDQLVLSFIQPLNRSNWSQQAIELDTKGKGVFLV
jgi:alpha-2-macroglobulin